MNNSPFVLRPISCGVARGCVVLTAPSPAPPTLPCEMSASSGPPGELSVLQRKRDDELRGVGCFAENMDKCDRLLRDRRDLDPLPAGAEGRWLSTEAVKSRGMGRKFART
ncbi:hypothetical protein E2C01_100183 [Portunus trituberculatus]|uniref:Uncharacterized protein n=1 Tax=Portunus trituberculatus TaxID=210409 RepID=A0A5B7KBD4_PORTR|nr:hypothetical protein [Portunus trituberculatus]